MSAIAIGRRAVWAVDPDGSISRIEPATGSVVARVDAARATAIAAGDAGVWFLTSVRGAPSVASVDPRTNTVGQIIPVQTSTLVGIAVGAGSVWATDPYSGVIWRIDPGLKADRAHHHAGLRSDADRFRRRCRLGSKRRERHDQQGRPANRQGHHHAHARRDTVGTRRRLRI